MEAINIDLLSSLIARNQNYAELMGCLKQINEACNLDLKYMKADAILTTAHRINSREQGSKGPDQKEVSEEQGINWSFGQFKIFLWVIIYQCLDHNIQISNIDQKITREIQSIFALKNPHFIRYEIRMLNTCKNAQMGSWSKEESKALEEVMDSYLKESRSSDGINWRWVSFKIFTQSGCKQFRNLNHCREKWNNHLNPLVKRGRWTPEEDIRLFELVDKYGHKWSKISKFMEDTRTEHMVKNRYNRFMRIWKIGKNSLGLDKGILVQRIRDHYGMEMKMIEQDQFGVKIEENSYEQASEEPVLHPECEQEEGSVRCKEEAVVKEEAVWGGSGVGVGAEMKQSSHYYHPYYLPHIAAFAPPPIFPFIH